MRTAGEQLELLLGDRVVSVPARIRGAVDAVLAQEGPFTPADLVQLDAAGAVVLVKRLVREGLLEVVR